MHTKQHPVAPDQVFVLPISSLAAIHTLPTIVGHYPLITDLPDSMREQMVTYFDTATYQLLRTGLAVYVEQDDEQIVLTVENLAASLTGDVDKPISRRHTVTEAIPTPDVATTPKAWPKALRKAVASVLSSHAELQPILLSRRQQLVRTMMAPAANEQATTVGATLGRLNLDHIAIWSPTVGATHAETPTDVHPITTLGQLAVTFAPTDLTEDMATDEVAETDTVQKRILTWLAAQPGLQPVANGHQQVLTEGLLTISGYMPGTTTVAGIQPEMLIADGCRLIWRQQLMTMLLQEAGVRYSQEREYVHEMRIAIRRLRAAAKLYGHFWPRKTIRPFLAALRKTGRLLGHIRNLDVTLAKARRAQKQAEEKGRAPKKLLKAWRQERQEAQQKLLHWLDSHDYNDFVAEFQHFCTTPALHSKHDVANPVPQQVRHVIPPQILTGFAAVRCYEALFAADLPIDYSILHNLRIACKYLRYNLEFVRHLLGPESETLITRLKALQELLGDLNDAVIAQTLAQEARQEDDTDSYQQLQSQRMAELSAQVPAALAALVGPESRTQLMKALARL